MKRYRHLFTAAIGAAVLLSSGSGSTARAENAGQAQKQDAKEQKNDQISAEDREIIEHMEMLKNLKFYTNDNEDMEMLLTLDVLTANE